MVIYLHSGWMCHVFKEMLTVVSAGGKVERKFLVEKPVTATEYNALCVIFLRGTFYLRA